MTNEAAERLRVLITGGNHASPLLDTALEVERHATVERIRKAIQAARISPHGTVVIPDVDAILDEEAAR